MTEDYATLHFMEDLRGEGKTTTRPTEEDHQRRFQDMVDTCGSDTEDTDVGIKLVFENDERKLKPFHMWGKDGRYWHRITFNTFESRGWIVRKGVGHDTIINGGRSYMGSLFYLTEEGQEMLDIRRDLL